MRLQHAKHVIEHALHKTHTAPGGDFFVLKAPLKIHGYPALTSRSATLSRNRDFPPMNQALALMENLG